MKICCYTKILTLDGHPLPHPDGTAATFRTVACEALLTRTSEDADGAKAYAAYRLAQRLSTHDFVDLSVEERAFLKQRIVGVRHYTNLVVGRLFDILEDSPAVVSGPEATVTELKRGE